MNLQEIKARLEKLNRYYDFLATMPDRISQLDRDAFLMQLRELYDVVLINNPEKTAVKEPVVIKESIFEKPIIKEVEPVKKEEPIKKTPTLVFTQPESALEEKIEKPIIKEEVKPIEPKYELPIEKIIEPVTEVIKTEPKVLGVPVTEETKKEVPVKVVEPIAEKKISVEDITHKEEQYSTFNEEFEELFIFKQATDLAAKLSESPVSNLNKAIGVNEKLHFINALFNGDVNKFNDAVVFFNDAGLFDKARSFMENNLIEKYAWLAKEKKSIAKDFIKLIRRRYL
jgi:hypothetical protein